MPGSTPATSQLDWLISTTAMIVLSWSKATRDLLKSFGWGIRALHQLVAATMVPSPRRLPHTISPLYRYPRERSLLLRYASIVLRARRAHRRRRVMPQSCRSPVLLGPADETIGNVSKSAPLSKYAG